ncbi:MAG: dynamin family protein, partial [Thermoanaerobaculia bacterium]
EAPPAVGLRDLARLAPEAGAPRIASEATAVSERIAEGRFYVACVGQFKRGKSSLLNALAGSAVLPVGVLPVTSVATVLRWGERLGARVRFAGGSWRDIRPEVLAAYVAEENNSENKIGVEAVEVFVPSPLLSSGMCLVDTPGIGSVFAGNTMTTREFVPHVDAAIVVLGADPPISGEELALVEEVSRHVEDLFFVLNKADRLPADESNQAARFTERVLKERLGERAAPLLMVSATERLHSGPTRDWEKLESSLDRLARESGASLVRDADQRAIKRFLERLIAEIDEQRDALVRPVAESEKRIGSLSASVAEAERSMADLGYLLMAEVDRLTKKFGEDREKFLSAALESAERELIRQINAGASETSLRPLRTRVREAAAAIARRHLDAWLASEQPAAEALYRGAAERFLALGNEFLRRFVEHAELGPETFPAELGSEAGFRAKSRLFYTELLAVAQPSPLSWVMDRARAPEALRRAVGRDAAAYLERLRSSNSARIQNDLIERVRESRRRLEAEIRSRLSEAVRSAVSALERAKARHAEGEASVAAELGRLDGLRRSARRIGGPAVAKDRSPWQSPHA